MDTPRHLTHHSSKWRAGTKRMLRRALSWRVLRYVVGFGVLGFGAFAKFGFFGVNNPVKTAGSTIKQHSSTASASPHEIGGVASEILVDR